ncbi:flagellar basal-body MS-ring/collar protein FliF [Granulicella cerasi]|uniref:Flagellar M-ring protein n=1 Tax=Granulicella cerasi TaxID=741063 RepID=A0ABW1Z406_9BACT|nr:flagellar basal-body MS-ring/collar protein FliF [Granulicella cerasi]
MAEQTTTPGSEIAPKPAALQALERARGTWEGLAPKTRSRLLLGVVVLAAACALVGWWSTRTDWKTLYSGLEGRDLQQVEQELAAAGITYQTTSDGSGVEVPAQTLDKARMEVAAKGAPQSGRLGFELFDKPNWVGSEFDEKVNYQRALEGELEHTIATIGAVRSARVHLVLPKESLFADQQQPAKASVVLKLKRPALSKDEVESIRNFVSSAVEGLSPQQVTLVDADGRVNLSAQGEGIQASTEEQALADKLVAMLEPLAGRENVRATVNISYDQSSQERTDEVVDPTQVVALQTQKSQQESGPGGAAKASGVPGTASNAAVSTGVEGKPQLPVYPTTAPNAQMSHQESTTYAVTKHTLHESTGPGRVARVTAAVLINDRSQREGSGASTHTVWHARTAEEMRRLEQLAQAAVGFDVKRGDSVVLQNIAFSANAPEPALGAWDRTSGEVKELMRAQPEMLRDFGAALMGVLLLAFVVRPVATQVVRLLEEARVDRHALPSVKLQEAPAIAAGDTEPMGLESPANSRRSAIDANGVLEYITAHVKKEPQQTTRLIEAWIAEGKGAKG